LPDILRIAKGQESFVHGNDPVLYSCIFLIGVLPGALYNVLQERFLVRPPFRRSALRMCDSARVYGRQKQRSSVITPRNDTLDVACMLFWGCIFQLLFMVVFFEVDFIPDYGASTSLQGFFTCVTTLGLSDTAVVTVTKEVCARTGIF
jgi:hypothetical protein